MSMMTIFIINKVFILSVALVGYSFNLNLSFSVIMYNSQM
jgi:hypothetical protein